MTLTCIAIDDEPLAMEKLLMLVAQIPGLCCVGSYASCVEALPHINELNPDILFLDIEMEQFTGIQMLETVDVKPSVIIISAYERYALKGYELSVADYILKPYSLGRLLKAVEKVRATATHKGAAQTNKEHMFVKTDYRIVRLVTKEIFYVEGMRDYLCLHTRQGKVLTQLNFSDLLQLLPAGDFARIHKSFAVNIAHIKAVEKHRVYINNEVLAVSETYRSSFYNLLSGNH